MKLYLDRLSYAYGTMPPVIEDLCLELSSGDRIAIFGANGSGKSTLARCLAGWLTVRGKVMWDGRDVSAIQTGEKASLVQLVDQNPRLQLSGRAFTVRDEIAFGPENLCLPQDDIRVRVDDALAALNLSHLAHRNPTTLSGGELQRVILAAALAMRPRLLVLDEPSTDLDTRSCTVLAQHLEALPPTTTVIIIDNGPHRWLTPLINRTFVLDNRRLIEIRAETNPEIYRTARLALPDAMNAFLDGQAANILDPTLPPPDTVDATAVLFQALVR